MEWVHMNSYKKRVIKYTWHRDGKNEKVMITNILCKESETKEMKSVVFLGSQFFVAGMLRVS